MSASLKPFYLATIAASLFSCRPATPLLSINPDKIPATEKTLRPTDPTLTDQPAAEKISPTIPARAPRIQRQTIAGIQFEGVAFDSRTHALSIIDQKNGPGSLFSTSRDVVSKTGALLAINGGFFTPEGDPLGLVISRKKISGAWNSASSLGSGIYRIDQNGHTSINRRKKRSEVSGSKELLQAGPLLVESGSQVPGLESSRSARRSVILTDGASRWWIGSTSACDLASLGRALSRSGPADWKIEDALNLDGGRSTDLYISGKLSGGPVEDRSFLNRPVRNFLILKAR